MKKDILIIDDDPVYRLLVNIMVKEIDSSLQIIECEDGSVGLSKLTSLQNSKHQVIILLDINMPTLNGWEFLEKIEEMPSNELPEFKLFMVSSSIDQSDKERSKAYKSISSFYHKPLKREDLMAIIGFD